MTYETKVADDGRLLVKDGRGFWIAVNIDKSIPSWDMERLSGPREVNLGVGYWAPRG